MRDAAAVLYYPAWSRYLKRLSRRSRLCLKRCRKRSARSCCCESASNGRRFTPDPKIEQKCLRDHASYDLWGDLYYLRTSIVHNLGIATSDVTKCALIKWFKPGDRIVLPPERMRAIFLGLHQYGNDLFREHLPPVYIQL